MTRLEKLVKANIVNTYDATEDIKERFLNFVDKNQTSFFCRHNKNGHITSSMLVLNETKDKVLLTHHKKFNRWLQLGGHNDVPGQAPLGTAVKEMFEEGFDDKPIVYNLILPDPLDIDVHNAGDHLHFDICFACVISEKNVVVCSDESNFVEWKSFEEILKSEGDLYGSRLKRMVSKITQLDENNKNQTLSTSNKNKM